MFRIDISYYELKELIFRQLSFFMYNEVNKACIDTLLKKALERTEKCFSKITNKYFNDGNIIRFNPFHSGQYAIFLYYLSNSAFEGGNKELAEKSYYLNKMLHSIDWYYEVVLPEYFMADHPMGSVLGRAKYSNYLSISQGCTIGNNHGFYPVFDERIVMHPNSIVVGKCIIGKNVEISSNTFVCDEIVPSNSIVFGSSPKLIIKTKDECYMKKRLTQFMY